MGFLGPLLKGMKESYTNLLYVGFHLVWVGLLALLFLYVWRAVGVQEGWVVAYLMLTQIWRRASYRPHRVLEREFLEGRIDNRLIRPIPVFAQLFWEGLGQGLPMVVVSAPFIVAMAYLLTGVVINPLGYLLGYLLTHLAYSLFYTALGWMAPISGRVRIFSWILHRFDMVVQIIPRELFPWGIYDVVPGKYIFYWPAVFALRGEIGAEYFLAVALFLLMAIMAEGVARRHIQVWGG